MKQSPIIIVDDDQNVLSALKRELAEEDLFIHLAKSGEDALEILSENPCKVIVADIKMPGMNGLELLAKVKELYPEMVRIVLSGHPDIKLILNAVNQGGIDRYLVKPWNITDVKSALNQSIEIFDLKKEVINLRTKLKR